MRTAEAYPLTPRTATPHVQLSLRVTDPPRPTSNCWTQGDGRTVILMHVWLPTCMSSHERMQLAADRICPCFSRCFDGRVPARHEPLTVCQIRFGSVRYSIVKELLPATMRLGV